MERQLLNWGWGIAILIFFLNAIFFFKKGKICAGIIQCAFAIIPSIFLYVSSRGVLSPTFLRVPFAILNVVFSVIYGHTCVRDYKEGRRNDAIKTGVLTALHLILAVLFFLAGSLYKA